MIENVILRETSIVLDLEVQNERLKFTPFRNRFYQSVISSRLLKTGEDYKNLKKVCVIIIMPEDPFGEGEMMYTVRRMVDGRPDIPFDDGEKTIYLYTKGKDNIGNPRLKELLSFIENTSDENAVSDTTKNIGQLVSEVRNDREVGAGYMKAIEYKHMLYEEGVEDGQLRALVSLVHDNILTIEEAARRAGLSTEEFSKKYKLYLD